MGSRRAEHGRSEPGRARRRTRGLFALATAALAVLVLLPAAAPATVEEQRARLPPPATCADPAEGVWMSHKYDTRFADWYVFTLRIRRVAPGNPRVVGDIRSHFWDGGLQDTQPPIGCAPGTIHQIVFMTAEGTVVGDRIDFYGTAWRPDQSLCGPRVFGYNLDHFSGVIDPVRQEFQSVNNDGGRSINDPTVFRRVRCLDPPPAPRITVAPPPLAPPQRGSGCGGRPW